MKKSILTIACLLIFTSCGYHVMGGGGKLLGSIETVTVPFFANKVGRRDPASLLSNIESAVTTIFIQELVASRKTKVVDEGEATLQGTIQEYSLRPVSLSTGDVVKEYRLRVAVQLVLVKTGGEEVLWKGTLSDAEEFDAPDDVTLFQENEKKALEKVARDLAKLFKERTIDDF